MDEMEFTDVEDGKDRDFNLNIKNAFKMTNRQTDEVHLFCAKKPEDKQRWLQAFLDERKRVQEDKAMGKFGMLSVTQVPQKSVACHTQKLRCNRKPSPKGDGPLTDSPNLRVPQESESSDLPSPKA